MLPGHADWRHTWNVGVQLSPVNQVIRSNHFKINTGNIPNDPYQYSVHDQPILIDNANKEDYRVNATLVILISFIRVID